MKNSTHIKKLRQGLVFLLGLFVAVFVVTQEVINIPCEKASDQQEQADKEEDKPQQEAFAFNCEALMPISGISIEPFQAILLAEINFESELEYEYPVQQVPLSDSPYYKTLFRQIISPNAP